MVEQRREEADARDRAGGVAECGDSVAVVGGERTRGEPGVELEHARGDEPRQRRGEGIGCRAPGDDEADDHRDGHRRCRDDRERRTEPAELAAQAVLLAGPRQRWQHDDAGRLRRECQHQVDAVGHEEAVGLVRAPEPVRDQDRRSRRSRADDDRRERRDDAARDGASAV